MRLTTTKKKEPELFANLDNIDKNQYFLKIANNNKVDDFSKIADKLGQLEDIEDELGIDLITLFKALKNGIWTNKMFIKPFLLNMGDIERKYLYYSPYGINTLYFYFKDYGKTWALNKEELL